MGRKVHYVENEEILAAVDASKKSFSSRCGMEHWEHSHFADAVEDLDALGPEMDGQVVRVHCDAHLTERLDPKEAVRYGRFFRPFRHYVVRAGQEPLEVVRSHWHGTLEDGEPSMTHGRLTKEMGAIIDRMTRNFYKQWKFRNAEHLDLESEGALRLCKVCLKIDETAERVNPFSYYSLVLENVARHAIGKERRSVFHEAVRDPDMDGAEAPVDKTWNPDAEPDGGMRRDWLTHTSRKAGHPAERGRGA